MTCLWSLIRCHWQTPPVPAFAPLVSYVPTGYRDRKSPPISKVPSPLIVAISLGTSTRGVLAFDVGSGFSWTLSLFSVASLPITTSRNSRPTTTAMITGSFLVLGGTLPHLLPSQ